MVVQVIAAIDTNIFISVINKEAGYDKAKKILDWIDEGKIRGIVSTIVLAEICSGYEATGDSKEKDDFLAHIIGSANYEIADVTVPVALDAGSLHSRKGFKLPDALIVASALRHSGKFLVSNNNPVGKGAFDDIKVLTASEFVKLFADSKAKE